LFTPPHVLQKRFSTTEL